MIVIKKLLVTINLLLVKLICKDNHSGFLCDDVQFLVHNKASEVILYRGNSSNNELFKILVMFFFPTLLN